MRLWKLPLFLLLSALATVVVADESASAPAFEEGRQYQVLPQPQKPANAKRISVEEFFCFCCPHCYAVDGVLQDWRKQKAKDVDFVQVPHTLGRPDGEVQARAFYVAQQLGVEEKIHQPLFAAIHDQHIPMNALDPIRDLFQQVAGVKPADFDAASSSATVDSSLRQADAKVRAYVVNSTPSVVVGGKYMVVGGSPDLPRLIDFLTDKVRKERKAS